MRRWARPAAGALAAMVVAAQAAAPDDVVRARLARVKQAADRIVIDGNGADWAGIPAFRGSSGRADDASRHIVSVAMAPRAEDLLVLIRTAARPSREDRAFWIDIDLAGASTADFQVGLRSHEPHVLWTFPEGKPAHAGTIAGLEVAIGEVVEVRIPYRALGIAPPARSWVRVAPFTWDWRTRAFVAWGAAVASFRLSLGDEPLDPPLPRAANGARALPLPLKGQWRVQQGAFGIWTHQEAWAYDLDKVDATLHPSAERDSRDAANYFSWGEPVFANAAGRVIRSRSAEADNPARGVPSDKPPNEVYVDIGGDVGLWFAHFKRGTSGFAPGARIAARQSLGLIGHSGSSTWPHLHMGLWRLPEGRETLPMALSRVRVSLNPGPDDPWARSLDRWDIREGFLVENQPGFP